MILQTPSGVAETVKAGTAEDTRQPLQGALSPGKEISPEDKYSSGENRFQRIKIIEVPDDVDWEVWAADWGEWVREKHRTWGLD